MRRFRTDSTVMSTRFAEAKCDSEVDDLKRNAIPSATRASTNWGISVWNEWSRARAVKEAEGSGDIQNLSTPLLEMKEADLAHWLTKFILEVRKTSGEEYPPKSLYALVRCFKRHFEQNRRYDVNPLDTTNVFFGDFRAVLDGEMKRLHATGLGSKVKQAEPITPDEETKLWVSGQLGLSIGRALLNTFYFYNCKVFGLRSFDEHRNLKCSQFIKKVDADQHVYMVYTDYGNKSNRGGLKTMKVDAKCIKQYENSENPDRCVVNIFEFYFSRIPSREGQFYFRPQPNSSENLPIVLKIYQSWS